jgi:hypothetical protein
MPQVNCHIPIKVCIKGRLSDAQLAELGEALIRAIAARMEQARRTLGEHGHAPTHETAASTHERFNPTRLSNGSYGLPSYDAGGKTVQVTIRDPLEESWQSESDEASRLAKEGASPSERAFRYRLWLLLNELRPTPFNDEDQLLKFIQHCHRAAAKEADTLNVAALGRLTFQELLDYHGAGFPNTWADRMYRNFHIFGKADLDALRQNFESRRKEALATADTIPAELWARGLPIKIDQARHLTADDMRALVINRQRLRESTSEITSAYAQALYRWLQAGSYYGLVKEYESDLMDQAEKLRRGEIIGDERLYGYWTKNSQQFRSRLADYKSSSVVPTLHEATLEMSVIEPPLWPLEGIEKFWEEVKRVDQQIAAAGVNDCLGRAFTWAFERGFFDAAGLEVWQSIKENGWKILFTAAAIFAATSAATFGAQFVPGLDVAVDIVLIIEFGFDVLSTFADLATALSDAGSAKSVLDMEHASAQLAQALVGTGAKVMLWAIGWAGGKFVNRVAKYRQGKKFIDEHGDTPEVRRALGDARGDVVKAERNLAAERERMAAEQRQKTPALAKPEPASHPPEPPVKPAESAAGEPKGKPPEPEGTAQKGTTATPSRKLDDIRRDLGNRGIAPEDIRSFGGETKRVSAALAERVERLVEHFSPAEVKQLGEYFSKNKIALTDDLVDALIQKVPQGQMGEYVRHLEIAEVHGAVTKSRGWPGEEQALEKTTTVHPEKPPPVREIVETPGSEVLRANLVKRLGEEPPPGYHAHHIIPEKQFGPGLDWMRKRFGKNINDADNGVFLAGRGGLGRVAGPTANPELTRLHNSYIHAGSSKEYAYTLTRRLSDLHGEQFLNEVRKIGEEMSNGTFKFDEIPRGWKGKWEPGMTAPIEPGFEPGWIEE